MKQRGETGGFAKLAGPLAAGALVGLLAGGGALMAGGSLGDGTASAPAEVTVPNLEGKTQEEAIEAILGSGLKLGTVSLDAASAQGEGLVSAVAPASGEKAAAGSAVDLAISTGEGDGAAEGAGDAAGEEGSYLLPESGERVYSESEVAGLSEWELVVARNEIFARHGRGFKDPDLAKHFNAQPWYEQKYTPEEFDALSPSPLSDAERANVEMLMRVEEAKAAPAGGNAAPAAQDASGPSSEFVQAARRALGIPDDLDGVTYGGYGESYWEGAGITVYNIEFYRNGKTIASGMCTAEGAAVRNIMGYNE